ncbi:MAG: RNA 2',3'-cyclic phosphodiesterase [Oligoflexia bacterium]|nr:RNA 2',3'-cyclic phosphodiesterase [Oligoflexia bacterium]
MRLFTAIEIDDPWRRTLAKTDPLLRAAPCKVSIVPIQNLHITLKFIGDAEENGLASIRSALLDAASNSVRFILKLGALGVFPEEGHPRIVWAGVDGDLEAIRALHAKIENNLAAFGIERDDRSYTPHITLARIKGGAFNRELLKGYKLNPLELRVHGVTLFESRLNSQGSDYRPIEHCALI